MIDRLDIHAYADQELPPSDVPRVEQEIAASPEAERELQAIQGLKTCLRTKAEVPQPGALWSSCVGRLDELDKVRRVEGFVGKYAWALCAVLFLVIMGGGLLSRSRSSLGMGQVASINAGLIPMTMPRLSQPEQLQSWIGDQTGQRPTIYVPPSQIVAIGYADQPEGRVIRVQIRDSVGLVDLMIIPNVGGVEGVQALGDNMYGGQVNGLNCVTWPDSGCAVLLIGARDHEQLKQLGKSLYR